MPHYIPPEHELDYLRQECYRLGKENDRMRTALQQLADEYQVLDDLDVKRIADQALTITPDTPQIHRDRGGYT